MPVINHNNGRIYFYCPAGAMWGYLFTVYNLSTTK